MPYVLPYKPTSFDDNHPETGSNTHYGEEYGDACYARMLGTYVENDKLVHMTVNTTLVPFLYRTSRPIH